MVNLLILAAPRTGSNYLCECLSQVGVFGKVDGFFAGTGDLLTTQFEAKCEEWFRDHRNSDIHACKFSLDYMDHVGQYVQIDRIKWLMDQFSHVVLLDRRDTVAQAVSYYIAKSNKQWTSENPIQGKTPEYSYWHILWYYAFLRAMMIRKRIYGAMINCPTLPIWYLDVVYKTRETIQQISDFTGVALPQYELAPRLKKQELPEKADYCRRFREERKLYDR